MRSTLICQSFATHVLLQIDYLWIILLQFLVVFGIFLLLLLLILVQFFFYRGWVLEEGVHSFKVGVLWKKVMSTVQENKWSAAGKLCIIKLTKII